MKSPAIAILWETLARQRWLVAAIVGDFALLFALSRALPPDWLEIDTVKFFALQTLIWFFLGIVALFSSVTSQSRTGRQGYPARMFLYPISTFRLVAYPMLFGMTTMVLGWLAVAFIILRPLGYDPPIALVAIGGAAAIAWFQAQSWWPFRSGIMRIVVVSTSVIVLTTAALWPLIVWGAGNLIGWILLSTYIAMGFALALRGVSLDRRGVRDGDREASAIREWFVRFIEGLSHQGGDFRSAARAQLWYEWRTKGITLVVLVISLTTLSLICLGVFRVFAGEDPLQMRIFFSITITGPLYFCWAIGGQFGVDDPARKTMIISPFIAARPMTTGQMASVKLLASATSLLIAYGLILLMTPVWLVTLRYLDTFSTILRPVAAAKGVGVIVLVAILGLVVVLTIAWKGMIGAMLPVLTGRPWVARILAFAFSVSVLFAVLLVVYITRDDNRIVAWSRTMYVAIPWAMGLGVVVKILIGVVAYREGLRRGMISTAMLVGGLGLWAVMTASAFGLAALLLRPVSLSLWIIVALGAVLVPPFGRLPLAPLALDWNRHQ
jgi:hypothetical protein